MICAVLMLNYLLVLFTLSHSHSPLKGVQFARGDSSLNKAESHPDRASAHLVHVGQEQRLNKTDGIKTATPNSSINYGHKYYSSIHHRERPTCPTWMYRSNVTGECQCGSDIDGGLKCNVTHKEVGHSDGYCITYDKHHNEVVAGECLYGYVLGSVYKTLPLNVSQLNEAMCGRLNRRGRLCSKCKREHYPLVYSYEFNCIKCTSSTYNWVKYIAIAILPTTCFYVLIILFRINVLSPHLYMLLQISQIFGSALNIRPFMYVCSGYILLCVKIIAIPYGIANVDFFRTLVNSICLDLTTLQTLALDYITAIYPLVLVIITCLAVELHAKNFKPIVWIWKPFSDFLIGKLNWDIHSSIIKVFSTFLLLSYGKLLSITFDLLVPTRLYNVQGERLGLYLYYDASYKYLSQEHLPYAILALSITFIFLLPPPLILILCLVRCCRKCLRDRIFVLQSFAECFYGYYKDGTEPGTRDIRWFPAIAFLFRIIFIFAFFGISKNIMCYSFLTIFTTVVAIIIIICKPYKLPYARYNTIDAMLCLILAMWCASVTCANIAWIRSTKFIKLAVVMVMILTLLPLVYISMLLVHWIYKNCLKGKFCRKYPQQVNNVQDELTNSNLINAMDEERKPFLNP